MITKLTEKVKFKKELQHLKKCFKSILHKSNKFSNEKFCLELSELYSQLRELEKSNYNLLKNDKSLNKSLFNLYYKIDSTKFNSISISKNN